jgi:hypothetical protein
MIINLRRTEYPSANRARLIISGQLSNAVARRSLDV